MEVNWFQVPSSIFKQEISAKEKIIYMYLCRLNGKNEEIYPSVTNIAKNCSVSIRTAQYAINSLVDRGLLRKKFRFSNGEQLSNLYEIIYPENLNDRLKKMPYNDYLKTDHWQKIRRKALKNARGACQLCNNKDSILNVHHRTYERRGEELLSDVIVLCQVCHEKFHNVVGVE